LSSYTANTDYKVTTATNGTITIDNETTGTSQSYPANLTWSGTLALFADSGGGHKSKIKLKGMKIWQADVLVRDFRPCYTNTGAAEIVGLYDVVQDAFYQNKGTGVFLRGQETENYLWVRGRSAAALPDTAAGR